MYIEYIDTHSKFSEAERVIDIKAIVINGVEEIHPDPPLKKKKSEGDVMQCLCFPGPS